MWPNHFIITKPAIVNGIVLVYELFGTGCIFSYICSVLESFLMYSNVALRSVERKPVDDDGVCMEFR